MATPRCRPAGEGLGNDRPFVTQCTGGRGCDGDCLRARRPGRVPVTLVSSARRDRSPPLDYRSQPGAWRGNSSGRAVRSDRSPCCGRRLRRLSLRRPHPLPSRDAFQGGVASSAGVGTAVASRRDAVGLRRGPARTRHASGGRDGDSRLRHRLCADAASRRLARHPAKRARLWRHR